MAKNFIDETEKIIKEFLKTGNNKKSENNISANLLLPFFKYDFSFVEIDFDDSIDGGARPDFICYSQINSQKIPSVIIECKKPVELKGLDSVAIIDKYLDDKFIKYIKKYKNNIKYFVFTSYSKYLVFEINDITLEKILNLANNKKNRDELVNFIDRSSEFFDLEKKNKKNRKVESNKLLNYLNDEFKSLSDYESTIEYIIKDKSSLNKFCVDLSSIIMDENQQDSLFHLISNYVFKELDKKYSPVKIAFRIFLTTRFPDVDPAEIDNKGNDDEKELFILSTVYSYIAKFFCQKYIEDLYSDNSDILSPGDKFLTAFEYNESNVSTYIKESLNNIKKNTNNAYKKIISRNEYFNWLYESGVMESNQFKSFLMMFKALNLQKSIQINKYDGDILGGFFEIFSEKFNKEVRKVFGQYYTPKPIVNFMWKRVIGVLSDLDLDIDNLKLLDPACGSGTFVVEGIKQLSKLTNEDITKKIVSFDISPMAASLAEVNIFVELLNSYGENKINQMEAIDVYNTDSLNSSENEYWQQRLLEEDDKVRAEAIEKEKKISKKFKKSKEYTLVVTNPPYNGQSNRTLDSLYGKFTLLDYLKENKHKDDRIRDDYVWFMGAIDRYINEEGVVSLITSDSYLYKSSFIYLRKYLYENYRIHEIYHFGTQMFDDVKSNTSIIIMSKLDPIAVSENDDYEIDYYDLRELEYNVHDRDKDERYQFLEGKKNVGVKKLKPSRQNSYSFIVGDKVTKCRNTIPFYNSKEKESLVLKKQTGLVTGYKELLTHTSKITLKKQIDYLFTLSSEVKRITKQKPVYQCTNNQIREFAEEILNNESKFQIIHNKINTFISEYELLPVRNKQNAVEFICKLIASILYKGLVFDEDKIGIAFKPSQQTKWSFVQDEFMYIYFEDEFSIPRKKSKSQGGPISSWSQNHEMKSKVVYASMKDSNGYARMNIILKDFLEIYVLKDISKGGKAHFLSVRQMKTIDLYEKHGLDLYDNAFLSQAIYNSNWTDENSDFVSTNHVPIPIPNEKNITLIKRVIYNSKKLNYYGHVLYFLKSGKRMLKRHYSVAREYLDEKELKSLKAMNLKDIQLEMNKLSTKNEINIKHIFEINNKLIGDVSIASTESLKPFPVKGKYTELVEKKFALGLFILNKLKAEKDLGRTKFQKMFYLVDMNIDEDLDTNYVRQAAGPLDYKLIYDDKYSIEKIGEQTKSFKVSQRGKQYVYESLKNHRYYNEIAENLVKNNKKRVLNIINVLSKLSLRKVELITTFYAIWSDFELQGLEVSEDTLIFELLNNWHPEKKAKFGSDKIFLKRTIKFMIDNDIFPIGNAGKLTIKKAC